MTATGWRGTWRFYALVAALAVLLTGCFIELPPGAKGPVWEGVVQHGARFATLYMWISIAVLAFGAMLALAGLLPGVDVFATFGFGQWRLLEVPVGLAVMFVGYLILRGTRFKVKVSDGAPRPRRKRKG